MRWAFILGIEGCFARSGLYGGEVIFGKTDSRFINHTITFDSYDSVLGSSNFLSKHDHVGAKDCQQK